MSMVSYYNPAAMYRHQQAVTAQNAQFHHSGTGMPSWYPGGYHHQGAQVGATTTPSYCMQDEQQMWHHPHPHSVFHQEFPDFAVQHHQTSEHEVQLPSPPITVSGSELSSPGGASGNVSPPNPSQTRPVPVRSPYEWIKKTSYQCQHNPEPLSSSPLLLDFTDIQDNSGKTRTKDKYRVVYTDHQRVELEKEFYYSRYITIRRKAELASTLHLSERQVKIWFQNRRAKERKQVKKREEFGHGGKDNAQLAPQQQHPHHLPLMQQMDPELSLM